MLIVPQQETVRLHYARTGADRLGLALSLVALVAALGGLRLAPERRTADAAAAPVLPPIASRRAPAPRPMRRPSRRPRHVGGG